MGFSFHDEPSLAEDVGTFRFVADNPNSTQALRTVLCIGLDGPNPTPEWCISGKTGETMILLVEVTTSSGYIYEPIESKDRGLYHWQRDRMVRSKCITWDTRNPTILMPTYVLLVKGNENHEIATHKQERG